MVAARGLLLAVAFTCCRAWVLEPVGSEVVVHGFSCPSACGILVSGPGVEPMAPALEGRFPTTGSSRKSQGCCLLSSPSLAWVWSPPPCGFTRPSRCVSLCPNFLSFKDTSHRGLGPLLITSFYLRELSSKYIHLLKSWGPRLQHKSFGG